MNCFTLSYTLYFIQFVEFGRWITKNYLLVNTLKKLCAGNSAEI
jgi:hypothetical protein